MELIPKQHIFGKGHVGDFGIAWSLITFCIQTYQRITREFNGVCEDNSREIISVLPLYIPNPTFPLFLG